MDFSMACSINGAHPAKRGMEYSMMDLTTWYSPAIILNSSGPLYDNLTNKPIHQLDIVEENQRWYKFEPSSSERTASLDDGGCCPPTPLSSKSIKKSTVPSACGVTRKTYAESFTTKHMGTWELWMDDGLTGRSFCVSKRSMYKQKWKKKL